MRSGDISAPSKANYKKSWHVASLSCSYHLFLNFFWCLFLSPYRYSSGIPPRNILPDFLFLSPSLLLVVAGISSTAFWFGSEAATLACFASLSTFVWRVQALLSPQKTESNSAAAHQAELAPQISSPTKKCLQHTHQLGKCYNQTHLL